MTRPGAIAPGRTLTNRRLLLLWLLLFRFLFLRLFLLGFLLLRFLLRRGRGLRGFLHRRGRIELRLLRRRGRFLGLRRGLEELRDHPQPVAQAQKEPAIRRQVYPVVHVVLYWKRECRYVERRQGGPSDRVHHPPPAL